MDNIIIANEKREHLFKLFERWGTTIFILTGIIGCNSIESYTFGWSFVIGGVLFYVFMNFKQYDLQESGGALTKRKLVKDDLRGLKEEELKQLRFHIYAKHGYNFNVNDGLVYLKQVFHKLNTLYPNGYRFDLSNIMEPCSKIGCNKDQLIMVLNNYELFEHNVNKIDTMSEEERNILREGIEINKYGYKLGGYDREGKYQHEGHYYYIFKYDEWYKPITNDRKQVYSKMSDIEKYNVEFIKSHEANMQ